MRHKNALLFIYWCVLIFFVLHIVFRFLKKFSICVDTFNVCVVQNDMIVANHSTIWKIQIKKILFCKTLKKLITFHQLSTNALSLFAKYDVMHSNVMSLIFNDCAFSLTINESNFSNRKIDNFVDFNSCMLFRNILFFSWFLDKIWWIF